MFLEYQLQNRVIFHLGIKLKGLVTSLQSLQKCNEINPLFYSIEQDASSEAEDSESKSNSSAFSPWNSTSDHRSIEKVANDNIMQGK